MRRAKRDGLPLVREIICPKCGKGSYYVPDDDEKHPYGNWLVGFWLLSRCQNCGYKKYGGCGKNFEEVVHRV